MTATSAVQIGHIPLQTSMKKSVTTGPQATLVFSTSQSLEFYKYLTTHRSEIESGKEMGIQSLSSFLRQSAQIGNSWEIRRPPRDLGQINRNMFVPVVVFFWDLPFYLPNEDKKSSFVDILLGNVGK